MERTNIVICPHCGAENIEGTDTCENCMMDLRTLDVPQTVQAASDSQFLDPISKLRLREARKVPSSTTVRQAVEQLRGESSGALVVTEGSRILGIFTERDVLKKTAAVADSIDQPITNFMTPDPVVLREDDTMATALNKMGVGGFRHIPVTRKGELVAMVTGRDVVTWLMSQYLD